MTKTLFLLIFSIIALERGISTSKHKEIEGKIEHKWTSVILVSSYVFCICVALIDFLVQHKNFYLPITLSGLLIILVGIYLRLLSIKTLKGNWSLHIKNIVNQQLIENGPYKLIRHPYYVAVMLELSGVSLYFNSFISFVCVLLIHLPLLVIRIKLEEKNLLGRFINKYKQYQLKTSAFLPRKSH